MPDAAVADTIPQDLADGLARDNILGNSHTIEGAWPSCMFNSGDGLWLDPGQNSAPGNLATGAMVSAKAPYHHEDSPAHATPAHLIGRQERFDPALAFGCNLYVRSRAAAGHVVADAQVQYCGHQRR